MLFCAPKEGQEIARVNNDCLCREFICNRNSLKSVEKFTSSHAAYSCLCGLRQYERKMYKNIWDFKETVAGLPCPVVGVICRAHKSRR